MYLRRSFEVEEVGGEVEFEFEFECGFECGFGVCVGVGVEEFAVVAVGTARSAVVG